MTEAKLLLTTLPNAEAAVGLARALVDEKLAACCSLIPAVRSIYRWDDKLQDDSEVLVLIKTRAAKLEKLTARLLEMHPYRVPELLAMPVESGHANYLEWLTGATS